MVLEERRSIYVESGGIGYTCMCRTGLENILPFTEILSTAAVRRGLLLSMLTIKVAVVCSCVPINKKFVNKIALYTQSCLLVSFQKQNVMIIPEGGGLSLSLFL